MLFGNFWDFDFFGQFQSLKMTIFDFSDPKNGQKSQNFWKTPKMEPIGQIWPKIKVCFQIADWNFENPQNV